MTAESAATSAALDAVLLLSSVDGDLQALRAALPQAHVTVARTLASGVEALDQGGASAILADAALLAGSPWLAALLRAEVRHVVLIRGPANANQTSFASVTRPLSRVEILDAFNGPGGLGEDTTDGGFIAGVDLSFAMLLGEEVLAAGYDAMRVALETMLKAEEPSDAVALSAWKARAHAMRTSALTLGFRRLAAACRGLDEACDHKAARAHVRAVSAAATAVLGAAEASKTRSGG